MSMQLHHTLMSQYKHGTASGIGSVSYESAANCVTPEIVIYGKCVQDSYTGKNLFDGNLLVGYFKNATGEMLSSSDFEKKFRSLYMELPAGTYTLSFTGGTVTIARVLKDGVLTTVSTSNLAHYTFESNGGYIGFSWYKDGLADWDENIVVQVERGDAPTPYEPYVGGIASPNPLYPQDIVCNNNTYKCHGKNLLPFPYADDTISNNGITYTVNSDGSITINGTSSGNSIFYLSRSSTPFKLHKGIYSLDKVRDNNSYYYSMKITDDITGNVIEVSNSYSDNGKTFELQNVSTVNILRLVVGKGISIHDIRIYPQIESGDTATEYEPYFNGGNIIIPELYAVGNVRDEYYPQTGKIVRRCKKVELTSASSLTQYSTRMVWVYWNRTGVAGYKTSIWSHFNHQYANWADDYNGTYGTYSSHLDTGNNTYLRQPNESVDTTEKFKAWLDEQKAKGTPVIGILQSTEPVIEYVDPVQITSVRGTNIIEETNLNSNMFGIPFVEGTQIDVKYLTHS